jgi:hypothetical protein
MIGFPISTKALTWIAVILFAALVLKSLSFYYEFSWAAALIDQ